MANRTAPYGAFNFLVNFEGSEAFGGFSDVTGLTLEITHAEYRAGSDTVNHVRKIPGVHKVSDVTLKRGIVSTKDLWGWLDETRRTGVLAKKTVVVKLLDEQRNPVQAWILRGVTPSKYTGPTLAAKGGTDVAMEELVLSVEGIDLE
ncbi:phage tail protein [Sorangium sp. So ce1389]|uniref:phage tail protein n=1 Tax=Sorangium sp. So ce1389 TaxID=3133336 RepID=UPI003F5ECDF6